MAGAPALSGPRVTRLGLEGLLFDPASDAFSDRVQARIFRLAAGLREHAAVTEVVPGMNNLMIVTDPRALPFDSAEALVRRLWARARPLAQTGKVIEIAVRYGGAEAPDLAAWAAHCAMSADEAVRRHAAGEYRVAAVGAMPGFGYLSGLDPALAMPRRAEPRARVARGAVIVGGAQTGVMPVTLPSGWHVIGMTDVVLFDPAAAEPVLMRPGDRVRFIVRGAPA